MGLKFVLTQRGQPYSIHGTIKRNISLKRFFKTTLKHLSKKKRQWEHMGAPQSCPQLERYLERVEADANEMATLESTNNMSRENRIALKELMDDSTPSH